MRKPPTPEPAADPCAGGWRNLFGDCLARKPRSDGEQSRERLLMAALRLFGEQGFARTSTRQIAQAAGANVAAISYYFGDKAGLYRAAFTQLGQPADQNIAMYDHPNFSLRQSLEGYYAQMLAPLMEGELAALWMRLWFREMLEPTGLWQNEIEINMRPEHTALVAVLARHLGLVAPDDETHRLGYALAGTAVVLMMGSDIVTAITPQLLAEEGAIERWSQRLADFAEAMVLGEKARIQKQQGDA